MKIEYQVSLADVEAWHREALKYPAVVRAFRKEAFWTAFTTGLVVGALCYGTTKELIPSLVVAAFFLLFVWALMGGTIRHESLKRARKAVEANRAFSAAGSHSLEVTSEGITEKGEHHALSLRWEAIAEIVQTAEHVFIVLHSLSAFIIPLRIFASPEERTSFIERIRSFCPVGAAQPKIRNA